MIKFTTDPKNINPIVLVECVKTSSGEIDIVVGNGDESQTIGALMPNGELHMYKLSVHTAKKYGLMTTGDEYMQVKFI